jgi:hypothetical protein
MFRRWCAPPAGEIKFISYSRWFGWFGRAVVVPPEVLGIEGRQLVSVDMSPSECVAAATWRDTENTRLPVDAAVLFALSRS